jgi:hypothetical protein
MKTVWLPVPAEWRQPERGRSEYEIGGTVLTLTGVLPLPEDPPAWMRADLARSAGARQMKELAATRIALASGWPALLIEATIGDDKRLQLLYLFLEWGAAATLRGPADAFDRVRDEVLAVLGDATVRWGDPAVPSLARIWEGVPRPTR